MTDKKVKATVDEQTAQEDFIPVGRPRDVAHQLAMRGNTATPAADPEVKPEVKRSHKKK